MCKELSRTGIKGQFMDGWYAKRKNCGYRKVLQKTSRDNVKKYRH